jgi:hypothetical protein
LLHSDRVKHAWRFGFNKIAVCLSTSLESISGDSTKISPTFPLGSLTHTDQFSSFTSAAVKLIGLDLLLGEEIWSFEPLLEQGTLISKGSTSCEKDCDRVVFARVLTIHSSPLESRVSLVVSTLSGNTYSWDVDASTGQLLALIAEEPIG